ncbi:hypothetical protein ACCS96_51635, partial [Rhizobium ruizarguesonis]
MPTFVLQSVDNSNVSKGRAAYRDASNALHQFSEPTSSSVSNRETADAARKNGRARAKDARPTRSVAGLH